MSTVDPNQRFVSSLQGPGLSLFVVSIVGGAVSLLVVGLRVFVRLQARNFGLDDGLMLSGLVIYLADIPLSCLGALSGLGAHMTEINPRMMVDSMMYLMVWMMLYVGGLCLIKTSICITTLRIATNMPKLRIALYALMGLTIATFLTTFIGILLLCHPVEANWDKSIVQEGRGTCAPDGAMIGLSYFATASTILTDLVCAILPAIVLWQTQMKPSTKILVGSLLSFGSFASISTMIRTPYIDDYNRPEDDLLFHIVNIMTWSNVETAVGLVAGSLPALRQLFVRRRLMRDPTYGAKGSHGFNSGSAGREFDTSGSKDRKGMKSNYDVDESQQGYWTLGEGDNSSDTVPIRGIRKDTTFEVEMSSLHSNKQGPRNH